MAQACLGQALAFQQVPEIYEHVGWIPWTIISFVFMSHSLQSLHPLFSLHPTPVCVHIACIAPSPHTKLSGFQKRERAV